jgi:RimJ/RimL family protein N-acetyltransferase
MVDDARELRELVVQVTLDAPRTQAIVASEVRELAKYVARIEESLSEPDALLLVACDPGDGSIVGELSAKPGSRQRLRHSLHIGLSIAQRARGQGVGRAMMQATLAWARTKPQLLFVRLACVASNTAARGLYESLGFSVEGVQRGYFLFEDGTLEDDVVMSLRLADLG